MINQKPNATKITQNIPSNFWILNISSNGVFGNKVYGGDLKRIWCESSKNQSEKCLDSGKGTKNDKGTKSDMVIDENVVYHVKLVDNEETMDEEKGIAEDVLIDVASLIYLVNFAILYIEEDECMSLILGAPFVTTTKAEIKFDKGRMTIRAGNYKIKFVRTLEHPCKIKERIKRNLDVTPVN
uniref:MAK10-like protein n=1 Tax=Tanacetum cinerariifolium TaxID=118510 RepID=A0A6L2NNP6_TANCI|nr:hypothetical protein [Tanacetum cinerariifolium]